MGVFVRDSCLSFCREFCVTFCGGSGLFFHGGNFRVCNSCDCAINPCVKKWRGLRYGNSHVDGVNYGKYLCVA